MLFHLLLGLLVSVIYGEKNSVHYTPCDGFFFLDIAFDDIQGDLIPVSQGYRYHAHGSSMYSIKYVDGHLITHQDVTPPEGLIQQPYPDLLMAFTGFKRHFAFNQESIFSGCGVSYSQHRFTSSPREDDCMVGYIIIHPDGSATTQIGSNDLRDELGPDDRMEGIVVWY